MKRFIFTSTMMVLAATCSRAAAQSPYGGPSLLPAHGGEQYVASAVPQSWNYASYHPDAPPAPEDVNPDAEAAPVEGWGGYGCDGCDGGSYDILPGYACGGGCGCGCCWYAGARGLLFTRDEENDVWLSFYTSSEDTAALSSNQASMNWEPGFEVLVGRYFDCGWALEASYWGIFSNAEYAYAYDPAPPAGTLPNLNTVFDFSGLDYDNGVTTGTVDDWYDGAQAHRVRRDYEFHNIELNLVRAGFGWGGGCCGVPCGCGLGCNSGCGKCCSSRMCVDLFGGVRFFKFDETFQYGTDDSGTTFTDPLSQMFYDIDIDNNLIGFQLGGRAEYQISSRWSLYAGTKMGLFGNYITGHSRIGGANGPATVNNGPNAGDQWDIYSSKNDVAMIGELDLGVNYMFYPGWKATLGYRAVAVTGVALTTNQIPRYFEDVDGVADIDSNGSLILHGAYCGLEYNW